MDHKGLASTGSRKLRWPHTAARLLVVWFGLTACTQVGSTPASGRQNIRLQLTEVYSRGIGDTISPLRAVLTGPNSAVLFDTSRLPWSVEDGAPLRLCDQTLPLSFGADREGPTSQEHGTRDSLSDSHSMRALFLCGQSTLALGSLRGATLHCGDAPKSAQDSSMMSDGAAARGPPVAARWRMDHGDFRSTASVHYPFGGEVCNVPSQSSFRIPEPFDSDSHRNVAGQLIDLTVLLGTGIFALDSGFIQILVDPKSDLRLVVRYAQNGAPEAVESLSTAFGILDTEPACKVLLALRRTDRLELVWYLWRWTAIDAAPQQQEESHGTQESDSSVFGGRLADGPGGNRLCARNMLEVRLDG